MKDYRVEMEDIWNKEVVLRKEIGSMNSLIGVNLPKMFADSLTPEESKLLALLK